MLLKSAKFQAIRNKNVLLDTGSINQAKQSINTPYPMPEPTVLILDDVHPVLPERLTALGYQVVFGEKMPEQELLHQLPGLAGIVLRSRFVMDAVKMDLAAGLKFIARVGAGMEGIDLQYAAQKGIQCFNSPEGNRDAVAEHALGMLLCLMNKLHVANAQVHEGIWEREANRGTEIKGKTLSIIGYGNMGSAFAQRLRGFDCHLLAYDKYKQGFGNEWVAESDMKTIFSKSDIISLHVPLTAETRYLVDGSYLAQFDKPIWLINTSRGPVVKTVDLVKALQQGKVKGAALDVNEYEKTSFEGFQRDLAPGPLQYLMQSDQVVLAPHIAGWTVESKYKLARVLADKIESWHFSG